MADLNDLHLLMGRALEGIENLERGVTGINKRLDENVQPVLDDYSTTKNRIIGACAIVASISGAGVSWLTGLFK